MVIVLTCVYKKTIWYNSILTQVNERLCNSIQIYKRMSSNSI